MGFDESLDDRQTETRAAVLARDAVVDLIERVEDQDQLVLRDADPVVLHVDPEEALVRDAEASVVAGVAPRSFPDRSAERDAAARRRELHGVAEQVDDRLPNLVAIA